MRVEQSFSSVRVFKSEIALVSFVAPVQPTERLVGPGSPTQCARSRVPHRAATPPLQPRSQGAELSTETHFLLSAVFRCVCPKPVLANEMIVWKRQRYGVDSK